MDLEEPPQNPLLSNSKNSDSRLQVQLHPLVLLTISDYITRHLLRKQSGPVVGAILGSQNGRDITMEHAFECKVENAESGSNVLIDADWFQDRLQQYKDVHKAPALDFVGWFTLASASGPEPTHLPIHQQLLQNYNESALLLTFHPSSVINNEAKGGKLPLAIYETIYEAVSGENNDKQMISSGETGPRLSLKFQELPYSIETDEAEMIGVDFVARGSGNARATHGSSINNNAEETDRPTSTDKGKGVVGKDKANDLGTSDPSTASETLSLEDEELITSLIAKSNAIQMLQERIRLIKSYLASLPPGYLNTLPVDPSRPVEISANDQISYPILRQINSMLARLPLLTPVSATPQPGALNGSSLTSVSQPPNASTVVSPHTLDRQTQQTDSQLVSLLSRLGSTLQSAASLGNKFQFYEATRIVSAQGPRRPLGQMPLAFDQTGFSDGLYTANPSLGSLKTVDFGKNNRGTSSDAFTGIPAYEPIDDSPEDEQVHQEWDEMDENM